MLGIVGRLLITRAVTLFVESRSMSDEANRGSSAFSGQLFHGPAAAPRSPLRLESTYDDIVEDKLKHHKDKQASKNKVVR